MRFAASRRKPARIYAHGNTRWQQSCSHSTAICNHWVKTRIELRTQEQPLVAEHRGGTHSRLKRSAAPAAHTQGTFHRRPQPLYTEKPKLSCSCFLPNTSPTQHSCSPLQSHHFPKSPLPIVTIVTTSLPHHFPSSQLPLVTTSLPHHFPWSPLPFLTTSLRHHFPWSPLPKVTTSLRSPPPFLTTSLRHHFPRSPLPFFTTSLRHHFPSSPLPFVTTSLRHHFPSSPLPFLAISLRHHFPRSPLPFVTTLRHSLLFFCDVLLCDVKSHTTLCHSLLFFCDVLLCHAKDTHTHHPSSMSSLTILFVCNTEVLLPNFLW